MESNGRTTEAHSRLSLNNVIYMYMISNMFLVINSLTGRAKTSVGVFVYSNATEGQHVVSGFPVFTWCLSDAACADAKLR